MSAPFPRLDRFVRWFFNCSTTAVLEHETRSRVEPQWVRVAANSNGNRRGAAFVATRARQLTPFRAHRKELR